MTFLGALETKCVLKAASCTLRFVHVAVPVTLHRPMLDLLSHPLNSSSNASCASGYLFLSFS